MSWENNRNSYNYNQINNSNNNNNNIINNSFNEYNNQQNIYYQQPPPPPPPPPPLQQQQQQQQQYNQQNTRIIYQQQQSSPHINQQQHQQLQHQLISPPHQQQRQAQVINQQQSYTKPIQNTQIMFNNGLSNNSNNTGTNPIPIQQSQHFQNFKPLSPSSSSSLQPSTSPQSSFYNNSDNFLNNSSYVYINSPNNNNNNNNNNDRLSRSPLSMNASPIHFNDPPFKVPVHLPLLSITNSPSLNSSIDNYKLNSSSGSSSFNSTPTKQSQQEFSPYNNNNYSTNVYNHQVQSPSNNSPKIINSNFISEQTNNVNKCQTIQKHQPSNNIHHHQYQQQVQQYHQQSQIHQQQQQAHIHQNINSFNNSQQQFHNHQSPQYLHQNIYQHQNIQQNQQNMTKRASNEYNNDLSNNNNQKTKVQKTKIPSPQKSFINNFHIKSINNNNNNNSNINDNNSNNNNNNYSVNNSPNNNTINNTNIINNNFNNNNNNNLNNLSSINLYNNFQQLEQHQQLLQSQLIQQHQLNDLKILKQNSIYLSNNDIKELMNQPTEYTDSEYPEIKGKFRIIDKIGQGTFSGVYKSVCLYGPNTGLIVALKRVAPTSSPARILNEIHSLLRVGGSHNVSALLGALRHKDQVTLVLPYFEHDSFKDYFFQMTNENIKMYLLALFTSLKHIHHNSICHRDVKPTNFLYSQKKNSFMLIDFGLAQEMPESNDINNINNNSNNNNETITIQTNNNNYNYNNSKSTNKSNNNINNNNNNSNNKNDPKPQQAPRAGTRGFRAPEVLLKYNKQTTAIDIWSVGVILLCIITGRYPFFISPDDMTSLAEIVSIIGTKKIMEVAQLLDKKVQTSHPIPPTSWRDLSRRLRNESSENKEEVPNELYDLLEKCLDPNPFSRISARDALKHPFLLKSYNN